MNEKNKIILRYKDTDRELIEVLEFFKRNDINKSGFIRNAIREKGLELKRYYIENGLGK